MVSAPWQKPPTCWLLAEELRSASKERPPAKFLAENPSRPTGPIPVTQASNTETLGMSAGATKPMAIAPTPTTISSRRLLALLAFAVSSQSLGRPTSGATMSLTIVGKSLGSAPTVSAIALLSAPRYAAKESASDRHPNDPVLRLLVALGQRASFSPFA